MECTVAVAIDEFTLALLEDASGVERTTQGVLLMRSIRYYIAERGSGRPGWPCSGADGEGEAAEAPSLELDVDAVAWGAFSREANRQGVSTDRLLRHGALFYLADRDSGRLTRKILEALEEEES